MVVATRYWTAIAVVANTIGVVGKTMISIVSLGLSIILLLLLKLVEISRDWFYAIGMIWFLCLMVGFLGPIMAAFSSEGNRPSLWISAAAVLEFLIAFGFVLHAYGKGFC